MINRRISERSRGKRYETILWIQLQPDISKVLVITPKGNLSGKEFLEKYDKGA